MDIIIYLREKLLCIVVFQLLNRKIKKKMRFVELESSQIGSICFLLKFSV